MSALTTCPWSACILSPVIAADQVSAPLNVADVPLQLPYAGPGLYDHADHLHHPYLQEPVGPGQPLLADNLTDLLTVQVHAKHHSPVVAADQEPVGPGQPLLADHITDPTLPLQHHLHLHHREVSAFFHDALYGCLFVLRAGLAVTTASCSCKLGSTTTTTLGFNGYSPGHMWCKIS